MMAPDISSVFCFLSGVSACVLVWLFHVEVRRSMERAERSIEGYRRCEDIWKSEAARWEAEACASRNSFRDLYDSIIARGDDPHLVVLRHKLDRAEAEKRVTNAHR